MIQKCTCEIHCYFLSALVATLHQCMQCGDQRSECAFVYVDESLQRRNLLAVRWLSRVCNSQHDLSWIECAISRSPIRWQHTADRVRNPIAISRSDQFLQIAANYKTGRVAHRAQQIIYSIRGRDRISSIKVLINRFLARGSNERVWAQKHTEPHGPMRVAQQT